MSRVQDKREVLFHALRTQRLVGEQQETLNEFPGVESFLAALPWKFLTNEGHVGSRLAKAAGHATSTIDNVECSRFFDSIIYKRKVSIVSMFPLLVLWGQLSGQPGFAVQFVRRSLLLEPLSDLSVLQALLSDAAKCEEDVRKELSPAFAEAVDKHMGKAMEEPWARGFLAVVDSLGLLTKDRMMNAIRFLSAPGVSEQWLFGPCRKQLAYTEAHDVSSFEYQFAKLVQRSFPPIDLQWVSRLRAQVRCKVHLFFDSLVAQCQGKPYKVFVAEEFELIRSEIGAGRIDFLSSTPLSELEKVATFLGIQVPSEGLAGGCGDLLKLGYSTFAFDVVSFGGEPGRDWFVRGSMTALLDAPDSEFRTLVQAGLKDWFDHDSVSAPFAGRVLGCLERDKTLREQQTGLLLAVLSWHQDHRLLARLFDGEGQETSPTVSPAIGQSEKQRPTALAEPSTDDLSELLSAVSQVPGYRVDSKLLHSIGAGIRAGKRLVILGGPPGTGKTMLATFVSAGLTGHLAASCRGKQGPKKALEALLTNDGEGGFLERFSFVRVRPEWSNPRELLGYRNVLKEGAPFVDGPLMPLLRRAAKDRGRFYFAVLDEMNLSHPEHYLSDILSAMESGGSVPEDGGPGSDGTGDGKVEYGTNIVLFGTVNYDETTLRLSPRLLSRGHLVDVRVPWKGVAEGLSGWEGDLANLLGALDGILKKADLGLGYRDQHFVSGYAMHHESERSLAIDEALCSRVLPRLRGGDEMADVLAKLTKEVKKVQGLLLPDESQLHERLIHLSERLKDRGFLV